MKKLIVLISLLLMATAAMGQTDKPQPKMNLRMGSTQQTVFPGDTIEPVVFVVEGAHVVEYTLLDSLTGVFEYDDWVEKSLATVSGTVATDTDPGKYLIEILATDTINGTSVNSMFYITVLSLNDAFVHSSGSLEQTVMAGDSIEPIVFDYQQFLNYRIDNLPSGLIAQKDTNSKTITIEGASENTHKDEKYTFALVAYLTARDSVVYNCKLEVEHIPVVTSIKILENDSQVVVAGDSIKPVTLKYENITDLHFKDIPKTLDPYDDPEAKTILLQGAIPEDFGDSTLVMSICAKGLDNNDTAKVKIIVKDPEAASSSSKGKSSSSVKSSSSKSKSSSSVKSSSSTKSSSSGKSSSSSKKSKDALPTVSVAPQFSVEVVGRDIRISGVFDADTYALLDMQGRVLRGGAVHGASFAIPVDRAGTFLVRIGNDVRFVSVK